MLLLNQEDELQSEETLELEIGQIVYFDKSGDEDSFLVKAEVIAVNELLQLIQILPLPDDESGLIRVPRWVSPDDISTEEDTFFM